jgi:CRP-like cAMP-binding protein
MDSNILNMVRNMGSPRTYQPGEKVFIEGSPGSTMYVVLDGNIEIRVGGKAMEVAGAGTIIGEMALIDSSNRSATVVAIDNCVLAPVNKRQFVSLIAKSPYFALRVMKILVTRLRKMDAMLGKDIDRSPSMHNDPAVPDRLPRY